MNYRLTCVHCGTTQMLDEESATDLIACNHCQVLTPSLRQHRVRWYELPGIGYLLVLLPTTLALGIVFQSWFIRASNVPNLFPALIVITTSCAALLTWRVTKQDPDLIMVPFFFGLMAMIIIVMVGSMALAVMTWSLLMLGLVPCVLLGIFLIVDRAPGQIVERIRRSFFFLTTMLGHLIVGLMVSCVLMFFVAAALHK